MTNRHVVLMWSDGTLGLMTTHWRGSFRFVNLYETTHLLCCGIVIDFILALLANCQYTTSVIKMGFWGIDVTRILMARPFYRTYSLNYNLKYFKQFLGICIYPCVDLILMWP